SAVALAAPLLVACAEPPSTPSAAVKTSTPDEAPLFAKSSGGDPIQGQYIVVFKDDVADPHGKAKEKSSKYNGKLKYSYGAVLKGFAAELSDDAASALRADPDVAY